MDEQLKLSGVPLLSASGKPMAGKRSAGRPDACSTDARPMMVLANGRGVIFDSGRAVLYPQIKDRTPATLRDYSMLTDS